MLSTCGRCGSFSFERKGLERETAFAFVQCARCGVPAGLAQERIDGADSVSALAVKLDGITSALAALTEAVRQLEQRN
ncbi:MAG: hypothetical protein WDN10_00850 [bacterium]